MADPVFPPQLPCALREGYGLNHVQPFARTEMVTGRARQRRTFTSVPSTVPVSWILTGPEAQLFEAWFRYTIQDGTAWFTAQIKSPLDGCEQVSGYRCRFTEMYSGPELVGRCHWRFRANLEIWERPMLAPGWEQFPDYILRADIIDLAVNREWPEA
ncbi:hypothetical protein A6D6_02699 [Alcanivorax xiamenensis]|uniref:Uncharacterized protein n=1 Tax=Alcanivorax xiamenensis TaxID=1177156 RepID=A0ABQ6Y7E8_9GAMM|nr:hypothetical protein [Alcanivorax xiamenensis]KAF0804935.1 hypothetical protein A6D6_02699 [Alcanivorax xiamenensis]